MLRIAIVTGGSRGIGRAVVRNLTGAGYKVRFCYKSDDAKAEDIRSELSGAGGDVACFKCDVADHAAVTEWVQRIERDDGPIGTVVNSAGITRDRALVSMESADWCDVMATNLTGAFNVARAVSFPMIKRRAGCIISMSSVSGVYGNAGQSNYSASKAGIIGMSRALAKELGGFGIRVNVVAPGLIDTEMTAQAGSRIEAMVRKVPLGRIGTADDVADTVAFLASDAAAYVTGQALGVDGGLVI